MQDCMVCKKEIENETPVIVKCSATFKKFVDGMHAIDITEELEIYHEQCAED